MDAYLPMVLSAQEYSPSAQVRAATTPTQRRKWTWATLQESDIVEDDPVKDRALVWKQDLRIVPLSAAIYLLCYLDRSNIGLFPGLVYYLTFWYRTEERSIRVAFILASATLAGAFGGAIAYGVGHMNGTHGLSAWRWLFILEGIPSCISSIFVLFYLPDYPETSNWLTVEEKALATRRLATEGSHGHGQNLTWAQAKETLMDWRLLAHYAIYFGISTPFSSLSLFTPSITGGLGYKDLTAQLMTVPPYAVAYVVTILASYSSDHFNARALHSAIFATIGAAGFMASALLPADSYQSRYGCLIVAASGAFSCIPPLLGFLSSNLFTTASAGLAIALNVSVGAPGQIAGVWIYKANEAKIGYPTGHHTKVFKAAEYVEGDCKLPKAGILESNSTMQLGRRNGKVLAMQL
ncbi:uncharacterized protein BP5553_04109 [Venustampulla echinocandica]|uniref:Major facilitator superfamily (MFS) profile domain-containing protein n=1 Tax=Venustampulla echinocandica TaxID=2656787 RepID=A0A370TW73_9HELO|nr:uncharacterized protein BP5553_04109 [Venustampulla echinocandica]RDL39769.1 hypothetical protein BP5553_04109 [Venustampulla echinocandica]